MGLLSGDWGPLAAVVTAASSAFSLLVGFLIWMMRRIVRGELVPAATVEQLQRSERALLDATERRADAREKGEAELRQQNAMLLQQARLWDAFLRTADANHSGSGHVAQTPQE